MQPTAASERGWCEPSARSLRAPLLSRPRRAGRPIPVTGCTRCKDRGGFVTLGLDTRPGRFRSDSGHKQIPVADLGLHPSLRSKLPCVSILALLYNQGGTVESISALDEMSRAFFILRTRSDPMRQYVVDAFADNIFEGNPAAVCILERWPEDSLLMAITRENNLPETAFAVPEGDGYRLRWFTPSQEVDLCGHATLATAYVLTRFVTPEAEELTFYTLGGTLHVKRKGELLEMDFPAYTLKQLEVTEDIVDALGARPVEVWRARDLLCVFETPEEIVGMKPDMNKLLKVKGALMQVTAPGKDGFDCVSRTFGPKMNNPEDPVCGSGHCHIIPYWADKLGKTEFVARQASPRGGTLYCRLEGERLFMAGRCALFAQSELMLGDLV